MPEKIKDITIEEFFQLFPTTKQSQNKKILDIDGSQIKVGIKYSKYVMVKNKGFSCVSCGITSNIARIERYDNEDAHINFYNCFHGIDILLTMDHIIPRSKGGKTNQLNLQPMCEICNNDKGNRLL